MEDGLRASTFPQNEKHYMKPHPSCVLHSFLCSSNGYIGPYIQECMQVRSVRSQVQLSAAPWTVACQAPLSMRPFRQEYQSDISS